MKCIDRESVDALITLTCDICNEVVAECEPYPYYPVEVTIEGNYGSSIDGDMVRIGLCEKCFSKNTFLTELVKKVRRAY